MPCSCLVWWLFAVEVGQIGSDRVNFFLGHAFGQNPHEAIGIVGAFAAGEVLQLLRHVLGVLATDARIDQVTRALRLVAADAGWNTGFFGLPKTLKAGEKYAFKFFARTRGTQDLRSSGDSPILTATAP